MSIATLEAMAAGLPVIVTRTGGSTELVQEGVNGHIFDWGDIDRLENLLLGLVDKRGNLRSMGKASRDRAGMFSWSRAASQYIDLFEELKLSTTFKDDVERVMVR